MYEYDYINNLPFNVKKLDGNRVRKTTRCSMLETIIFMEKLCSYLIKNPDPTIVPVYDFCYCGRITDGTHQYEYEMEQLYQLPRDEKRIVDAASDDWYDSGFYPSQSKIEIVVASQTEYPDLFNFLESITRLGRYTDLHSGNLMLDRDGNYRLVDLESFFHTPLDHYKNRWFQDAS